MNWKFSSLAVFLAIIFLFLAGPRPVWAKCGTDKPNMAQNMSTDGVTSTGATLHWSDPTWNCNNGTAYFFKIILGHASPPTNNQGTVSTTTNSSGKSYTYNATGLDPLNPTYNWYARPCYTFSGTDYCSINTQYVSFTLSSSCTPATPTTASLTSPTSGSTNLATPINFQWAGPTSWNSCNNTKNYQLVIDGNVVATVADPTINYSYSPTSGNHTWTINTCNETSPCYTSLTPNSFSVAGACTVTIPPPVLAAGGLTTTNITDNSATANWSGSALAQSNAAWNSCVSGNNYYKFTDPNGSATNFAWDVTTSGSFSGLTYGINYTWSIVTCDSDIGCSSPTFSLSFTPTPPATCAP